jgi:programmed cell death protein 5
VRLLLTFPSERPVSRIALVSPERSKEIETILLKMAQTGQLRGQVTEEQLIDLLDQVLVLSFTPLIKSLKSLV